MESPPESTIDRRHLLDEVVQRTACAEDGWVGVPDEQIHLANDSLNWILISLQRSNPTIDDHWPENILDDGVPQIELRRKVVIERALGQRRFRHDVVDAHTLKAVAIDLDERGVENLLPGFLEVARLSGR